MTVHGIVGHRDPALEQRDLGDIDPGRDQQDRVDRHDAREHVEPTTEADRLATLLVMERYAHAATREERDALARTVERLDDTVHALSKQLAAPSRLYRSAA